MSKLQSSAQGFRLSTESSLFMESESKLCSSLGRAVLNADLVRRQVEDPVHDMNVSLP